MYRQLIQLCFMSSSAYLPAYLQVGSIVALSCWLPLHKEFLSAAKSSSSDQDTTTTTTTTTASSSSSSSPATGASCSPLPPILQCHGDCDPVVPYKWGQLTSVLLKQIVKNTSSKRTGKCTNNKHIQYKTKHSEFGWANVLTSFLSSEALVTLPRMRSWMT